MLRNLKNFFDQHMRSSTGTRGPDAEHALQVATAALLVEVMRADREMKDVERAAVIHAIESRFQLNPAETSEILRLAEAEADEATDYFQFTSLINDHYSPAEKEQVVEHLWHVALADHEVDRFERTLVHKVADLLHVSRAAQIAARDRAKRATVGSSH